MDAAAWDQRYASAPLVWSAGPNQFVESELTDVPPGRALDIACGEGRNAIWLASRGWEVTACDFSSVAIDKARALAGDLAITWAVGDALTLEESRFDLALLAYLQLPPHERTTAVRRAWAALSPGGRLLVVAHDSSNLAEGTGGPQDPAVLYTADDVLDDLSEASYAVVRAEPVARLVPADDDHGGTADRVALDALVHLLRQA